MLKIFQLHGSVFPHAGAIALPCAILAGFTRHWIDSGYLPFLEEEGQVLKESQAWSGFSFLIGFLIVFRTSQSYNRFWDGLTSVHRMQAEWFDSASALVAFTSTSQASCEDIAAFKHQIVRLLSLLHAAALGALEFETKGDDDHNIAAFSYELLDPESLDVETRKKIKNSPSRCELIFTWVQIAIVQNHASGVLNVAPPILSRTFQTLANGMIAFHDSTKIADTPFPFPYAQTCDFLLVLHWLISPFVFSQFSLSPLWATCFCFVQVFVFWALNLTAVEIENPFGTDANDIDGHTLQQEMNSNLRYLLHEDVLQMPQLTKKFRGALQILGAQAEFDELLEVAQRQRSKELSGSRPLSRDSRPPESTDGRQPDLAQRASSKLRSSLVLLQHVAALDVKEFLAKKGHGEIIDAADQWRNFDREQSSDDGSDDRDMDDSADRDLGKVSSASSNGQHSSDINAKEPPPPEGVTALLASALSANPAHLSGSNADTQLPPEATCVPNMGVPRSFNVKNDFRGLVPAGISSTAAMDELPSTKFLEVESPLRSRDGCMDVSMVLGKCCVQHGGIRDDARVEI